METIGRDQELVFERYLRRPTRGRLARVVEAFHGYVWALALRFAGNEEDAADIAQDLFLSLLLHPPAPGDVRSARGYLACRVLTLSSHAERSRKRRRQREARAVEKAAAENALPPGDLEAVREAIGELPERTRMTIEYRYLAGLRNREIAELLGVSERTIEDELRHGRETLRSRLGAKGTVCLAFFLEGSASGSQPPPRFEEELLHIVHSGRALLVPSGVRAAPAGIAGKKAVAAAALLIVLAGTGGWIVSTRREDTSQGPSAMPKHTAAVSKASGSAMPEERTEPSPNPSLAVEKVEALLRIRGWVVDGEGAVVPGAKVSVLAGPAFLYSTSSRGETALLAETVTAEGGEFEVERRRPENDGITVVAEKEGLGKGWSRVERVLSRQPGGSVSREGIVVALFSSTAELTGRVVDQDDLPVEGATVRVSVQAGALGEPMTWGALAAETAMTGARGEFTVKGLPASAPLDVVAGRAGYFRAHVRQVMAGGAPIEIRLERGVSVSGRVTTTGGEPVAGARVSLVEDIPHRPPLRSFFETAGDDGRFALDGVPVDRYRISVETPGGRAEQPLETIDVDGPLSGLEIVLDTRAAAEGKADAPGAGTPPREDREVPPSIRGTVRDPRGNPVVAVLAVTRYPQSPGFNETVRETVSKPDGSFVLEHVSFPTKLVAAAPSRALRKEVAIEREPAAGIVVSMEPCEPCRVEGRVVTPAGAAVPGAGVLACRTWENMTVGVHATRADANGCFVLEGILPDTGYYLHAVMGEVHGPATRKLVRAGVTSNVDVLLPPSDATLSGVVRDLAGNPLEGIKVFHDYSEDDLPREERVVSGAGGAFQVPGLMPGKHRVVVDERGYGMWIGNEDGDQKIILPGSPLEVVLTATRTVSFEVVDPSGRRLDSAYVRWGEAFGHPIRAAGGRFSTEVPETATRLTIQRDYRGLHPVERDLVWPPAGDLDLGRIELDEDDKD
jgi:RNA polymerase sigma-70 factor (ECF subfamily)